MTFQQTRPSASPRRESFIVLSRTAFLRRALLTGTSALALMLGAPDLAEARYYGSSGSSSATTIASDGAQAAAQQAAAIAKRSQESLARTTQALQAMQAAQAAARNAAQGAASAVTNGLSPGGLVVDPRVIAGTGSNLWVNANLPTQTTSGGQTTVTIEQQAPRAIMTWQQFNVGKNTLVYFDQSGGNSSTGNNWIALNRIDATGTPSQIQGQIKAEGTVLLINPNGIIFSGTSQINVHSLIASAMDLNSFTDAANGAFKASGDAYAPVIINGLAQTTPGGAPILAPSDEANANKVFLGNGLFVNSGFNLPNSVQTTGNSALFSTGLIPGQNNIGIRVEVGASITTDVSGFDNGGFVALLGPQVSNAGSITTSAGAIILAAGSSAIIAEPASGTTQTAYVTRTDLTGLSALLYAPPAVTGGAYAVNDGLLVSRRGHITLVGDAVEQLGLAEATTSITRAGSITLAANGTGAGNQVIFGAGSVTAILPDENGETIPSDAASLANFTAPRIDVSAPYVDFASGSLVYAPSANMTVTGPGQNVNPGDSPVPVGRVLMEAGSTIDLAGLTTTRSVADYLYTFKVTANDVADTPLAKNLIGKTVTIDLSQTGTRADGKTWVGSPLFASSGAGYLANIAQGIDQLLSKGGSLTFASGGTSVGNRQTTGAFVDVVQAPGSAINVSGGFIAYAGARIATTQLIGSDGRFYDIGKADPSLTNVIASGGFTVEHERVGITEYYISPLHGSGYDKPGYINGLSAGSLAVTAANPILAGQLISDIVIGTQQRQLAQAGTGAGGAQATPDQLPNGAALSVTLAESDTGTHAAVILDTTASDILGPGFAIWSPLVLPTNSNGVPVMTYSTEALSAAGFGSITINGADTLSMMQGASLSVRAGGSIKLANVTTVDGTLTAHGGSITLSGWRPATKGVLPGFDATLTLGAHALLDVSGQWINDTGLYGDDVTGALYINGGSVSLSSGVLSLETAYDSTTQMVSAEDKSLSILLAAGSVIDLSSGGYVGSNGRLKLGSDGLPVGPDGRPVSGGSLSLTTYDGAWTGSTGVTSNAHGLGPSTGYYAPQTATAANVIVDGTIYAGGLSQGGTFSLQVPTVTIDGDATEVTSITAGAQAGTVVLPPSFFTDSGFSSYKLTSTYGSATVTAGTTLTLKQQTYLAPTTLPATGARLRDFAALGFALDGMRHAVDLTLSQSAYGYGVAGDASATAKLLIDEGVRILADPLAKITLSAGGPAIVLGSITAHGGSIDVTQGYALPTGAVITDGLPQYVWIGERAVLDVSGTFVRDPKVSSYATGTAHAGGSISLGGSLIIAEQGALFDISGASGTVEVPAVGTSANNPRVLTRKVWSNGGSLTLSPGTASPSTGQYGTTYFAGTIKAAGGAPEAAGGTLNVSSNAGIVFTRNGNVAAPFANAALPGTRAALTALLPTTAAATFLTADTLNTVNSGLDSVSLTASLYFNGNVDVKLAGSLLINGGLTLLPDGVTSTAYTVPACTPAGACIPSIGGTQVTLEAGYIRLLNNIKDQPTLADGTLTLKASRHIDLGGLIPINNAGTVNLVSGGDIRFLNPSQPSLGTSMIGLFSTSSTNQAITVGGLPSVGALLVADNLSMTARTIYPETDTAFLLMSRGLAPASVAGTHNTITFASNGQAPVAPLSAGGAIVVDARHIVQGGALMAPLGTIQLGFGPGQSLPRLLGGPTTGTNPYTPTTSDYYGVYPNLYNNTLTTIATDSVTLLPGSLTSVTADGLMIPYGKTTDGAAWSVLGTTLSGPPSKLIVLGGGKVDTQAGAVIDGRGGGDIYATEFVPGTGGSRNVLTTTSQTVYALVPGYDAAVAPYAPGFSTKVALGSTVTLPGGNGIPAGTYTLLPAEYATLPGAFRVAVVSTNANPQSASITTADGSVYMTGTLGNALNGSTSSQTAMLQIQSKAVWTQYSQIDITAGNSYFAQLAATNGTVTPRLAQDAAKISIAAASELALNATNRFAPAAGGRGGQLDITGTSLLVTAKDLRDSLVATGDYGGYLVLDADMISNLGIESVLLGGYRADTSEGTLITATALNLDIATDAEHPLTGPELLLVSLAPTAASSNAHGLIVADGSVITAKGAVAAGSDTPLIIGVDPVAKYTGSTITGYTAGVSGDGSLLRVSGGGLVNVARRFVPGIYTPPATTPTATPPISSVALGKLAIGANVTLVGNTLTLDSSGSTTLADTARLAAKNYDLSGSLINLGGGSGGLVVSRDLIGRFAGADIVRLRSASVFNLYGSNAFGDAADRIGSLTFDGSGFYSDGGATSITAGNIAFVNTQAAVNSAGANTGGVGGSLSIDASGTVSFGAGAKTLAGFASFTANAGSQILFIGQGSLNAKGANIAHIAPAVIAAAGAAQSLTTTGALTLLQGAGTAPLLKPTDIGGALSLTAGSIAHSGTLIAQGGKLTLEATTGDLVLSGNALLSAAGTRIAIGDLIQDTPAGAIRLYADAGNVTLGAGTAVDVSAAGRGYAGSLAIYSAGTMTLQGTLLGGAQYTDLGGEFTLIANRLDGGLPLGAGFTRSFQVSLGQGDITIASGQTLTSENVLLVANTGGITVDGTIDASSASGGKIALYGAGTSTDAAGTANASGVTIGAGAKLYARYQAPDKNSPGYGNDTSTLVQRGGTITLGTTGTPDGTLNAAYGYQNVPGSGAITVASGAIFDVSGGAGGTNIDNTGGSVIVRAPILANNAINVSFNGTVVTNARADGTASGDPLVANAFATWSTTDNSTDPNKHFDGIIDPAGFFDASGTRLISADANGLYPTSTADAPASGAYTPHVNFYQKTLLDFVNAPFNTNAVAASFAGTKLKVGSNTETALQSSVLHLRPEIDLVNPSTAINNGNINVASNWNFGAGSIDSSGNINLLYRTADGREPGTLTLRAINNVQIDATITDGFFANYQPSIPATDAASQYAAATADPLYQAYLAMFSGGYLQYSASGLPNLIALNPTLQSRNPPLPANLVRQASAAFFNTTEAIFNSLQFELQAPTMITGSAEVIDQYNQYYAQYVTIFRAYEREIIGLNSSDSQFGYGTLVRSAGGGVLSYADYVAYITKATGRSATSSLFINPLTKPGLVIPTAPTTGSAYYNIANGLGSLVYNSGGTNSRTYTTTASDYITKWVAYLFNVAQTNINNSRSTTLQLALNNTYHAVVAPTLDNVAGVDTIFGILGAIAIAPPYAPPAYTSIQPGYLSSSPTPSPADLISNNAGGFVAASGATTVYNATSSADLMSAAVSGKGSFSYDFVGGALFNASGASSVNPNAVVPVASLDTTVTGNVTVDGHTSYINPLTDPFIYASELQSQGSPRNLVVNVPTLVRTGTGSITIAAAGDFALLDQVAPGAVYTAGYVADNAAGFTAPTIPTVPKGNGLITNPVWARGGGDITITAGRDIIGIETPVDPTGSQFWSTDNRSAGVSTGQFWSAWYYVNGKSTGSSIAPFDPLAGGEQYSSWINYGTFFQGFGTLGGGDITLKAGRDVKDVSASLPETIQVSGGQSATGAAAAAHYYGGGNLLIEAGNDVLSGVYYVGRGTGLIRAGGSVIADAKLNETRYDSGEPFVAGSSQLALLLAVQDSTISVQATGSIVLGGIYQPTRIPADLAKNTIGGANKALPVNIGAAFDSYGAGSGVALVSTAGDIGVGGAGDNDTLFTHTAAGQGYVGGASPAGLVPPNLAVTALTGDIAPSVLHLYPSATGQLSLVAGGSIVGGTVTMRDIGETWELSSGAPATFLPMLGSPLPALTAPLHSGDPDPVLIYAGEDIYGGPASSYTLLKKARLWAGRDITNVTFTGMNVADGDITSIIAGRDIKAEQYLLQGLPQQIASLFTLYGPGEFLFEAGRDLGPFNTVGGSGGGILAVGNGADRGTNDARDSGFRPYLPLAGADITLRFGVSPGIDYAAAIATYGDAGTVAASGIDFVSGIIPQLEQLVEQLIVERAKAAGIANPSVDVTLTPAEAAAVFTALSSPAINQKLAELAATAGYAGLAFNLLPSETLGLRHRQQEMKLAIDRGFLDLLTKVSLDYNNVASPYYQRYARAYEAISTLFPASLGYTDNGGGGSGAAPVMKHHGDLRMARSLIETQTGGDINLLGPGGNAYVGSNSADTLSPAQQGILTLQGGSVRSYTDGSVLIYQSRVFTEQGGNVEMFSANGDLNAGKGPKSASAYPPLKLICDANGYCRVSPAGLVTGAGIGALISVPGQDPTKSNAYLSAPHGRIDFGAAGGRSAGELNLVAQQVLNAFNVQVGGATVGIPTVQGPPVAALSTASNATAATQQSALPSGHGQSNSNGQSTVMIVEIIGYGGAQGAEKHDDDEQPRRAQ
ncbi:filamentous haemagglutinin family protein [Bradyrhizobium liaoningense]